MKIRTRLLVFLLPTLVSGIAIVSALLAYSWYGEIVEGFRTRLKSSVVASAAIIDRADSLEIPELEQIRKEFNITRFYFTSDKVSESLTPIYRTETGKQMTGYAPLHNADGTIRGQLAADMSVRQMDKRFQESLVLVILSAGCTTALLIASLLYISNKISGPVQSLNNTALAVAAGQYGESAGVEGPKEIAELANTLNTMSQCLLENINRLKENSLLRERMYGEYECAMLLQHLMLQKNIDDCRSDAVAVRSLTLFSDTPRGLLLDFPKPDRSHLFQIHLAEADETGFEGMYELLTKYKHSKERQTHTSIHFDRITSFIQFQGPHQPIFWSLDQKRFLEPKDGQLSVESGDFFFLFNEGLSLFFKERKALYDLLSKVLKVFAQDGLETTASMLQKELTFATKRKDLSEDIHLLCFQILNP